MSISLTNSGRILAGMITNPKAKKRAIDWVNDNAEALLKEWRKYHV